MGPLAAPNPEPASIEPITAVLGDTHVGEPAAGFEPIESFAQVLPEGAVLGVLAFGEQPGHVA
jgi:hypothetical protein